MAIRIKVCRRLMEMYGCPPQPACALERVLYESASPEEYADMSTLNERAVWCIKLDGYERKIRRYGPAYSCGFFHDDTAYIDHVKARYATPFDPALLDEFSAFAIGFVEAYHGSAAEAKEVWVVWVAAAFIPPKSTCERETKWPLLPE
jgi:hypothetical protein